MATRYSRGFRDDVVRVVRRCKAPVSRIVKDIGISDATLGERMKESDVEDGVRPGTNEADAREMREQSCHLRRSLSVPSRCSNSNTTDHCEGVCKDCIEKMPS